MRNYIGYVAASIGLDPDVPVPDEKRGALAAAMREFENGRTNRIQFSPYAGELSAGSQAQPESAGGESTPSFISIPDTTQIQATPAELTAMNTPRDGVADPFSAAFSGSLRTALETEQQRLGTAERVVDRVATESAQVRGNLVANLQQTVGVKREINQQVLDGVTQLQRLAAPALERQEAIARQLRHLNEMNPLEQSLRSVFDPNYNRQALLGEARAQEQELELLNGVFDERYRQAQILSQLATADYGDNEAVANLMLQNGGEDVRLALQSFNLAGQSIDTLLGNLQADSALTTARAQARQDVMAGLTPGQINAGLAAAESSPAGTATINGVPIRHGELLEAQGQAQQQALNLANLHNAVESGNAELVEKNKQAVLESSTEAAIQSAIRNGGMIGGFQFDVTQLADRLSRVQASRGVIAQQQALESAPQAFIQLGRQLAGINRAGLARAQGLLGSMPQELVDTQSQILSVMNRINAGIGPARESGTLNQYLVGAMPEYQALVEQHRSAVEGMVTRWAGGNDDLKALGSAWMAGQPIEPGVAIRSMIHFARNGRPAGTTFDGAGAQLMRIVQEEVTAAARGSNAAGSMSDLINSTGTSAEREAALVSRIAARVQGQYQASLGSELESGIPDIARSAGLPFRRISSADWSAAITDGERTGLEATAVELGMSGDDFERMLADGESGPLWTARKDGLSGAAANFSYWESSLSAAQMLGVYRYLGANHGDTGFTPTYELYRVVSSPEFAAAGRSHEVASGNMSLGGFIARSAGGGNFAQNVHSQQQMWQQAYQAYNRETQQARQRRVTSLVNDPIARARYILDFAGGLSDAEEAAVLTHIRGLVGIEQQTVEQLRRERGSNISGGITDRIDQMNRTVDSFILSGGNTGDPELDRLLRRVKPVWETYAGPATQAANRAADRGAR
jgi:hypothetical protein